MRAQIPQHLLPQHIALRGAPLLCPSLTLALTTTPQICICCAAFCPHALLAALCCQGGLAGCEAVQRGCNL